MMSRKRVIGVATLASCGVILGACAPQADDTMSDGSTPQPIPSQSGQSGQSGNAAPESGPDEQEHGPQPINGDAWVNELEHAPSKPGKTPAIFHDMRVGEHDTFYRVVVEFTGEATLGYYQSWADKPIEQGRGQELDVEGVAYLDFVLTGTSMPITDGQLEQYYQGPRNLQVGPLDVREDGTFEDSTHIVIGMDHARNFQLGFLTNPLRAVIDIQK